jgi:diguanylate cyclase (GGDEF)-like protein/PAS domain S-box-containing protein
MTSPDADGPIESAEELRETLLVLRREYDAIVAAADQSQHLLDALESLLTIDPSEDPFPQVFDALRRAFTFSQALMLAEIDANADELECIVAEIAPAVGTRWPIGAQFRKVLAGRVVATIPSSDAIEWRGATGLGFSADESALFLPVRVRERRGILVLVRAAGLVGFDRQHVSLARRCSLLASHALATRFASQSEAESLRLRELTTQLQLSEQEAKRNADLLNEVVNVLPVALTVQDADGRIHVINDAAASVLGTPVEVLRGRTPCEIYDAPELIEQERREYRDRLAGPSEQSEEQTVVLDGKSITLLTTSKAVRIFDEHLLLTASLDISERKRFEDELSRRAFHDQLTGLPNRELMQELIDQAIRTNARGGMFALAFIDLDNFKQVNDYYSHAIGDRLLIEVSKRISEQVRPGDRLARISGDEFLLLINPLDTRADLPRLIDRVIEALKAPFEIEGHRVLTSASLGASIFPLHGDDYETLRRGADSAMYRAKRDRKGSATYYDHTIDTEVTARMALEQKLRVAISEKRFRAAYQPKIRLSTGEVIGFEALVRWIDIDDMTHLPDTFIELAGELGLLDDITQFVLQDVERSMPELTARFGPDISVSVNVSPRQAADATFMASVLTQLAAGGLANRFVLELTEDALETTQRFQRQVLPQLREHGVRVSIDDFGTGFSSLSTLTDITADEVKVDRTFITAIHEHPRSQGILKAIESLCAALDINVVAEGVETEEELAYIRRHTSIDIVQGYYFAAPMLVSELPDEFLWGIGSDIG